MKTIQMKQPLSNDYDASAMVATEGVRRTAGVATMAGESASMVCSPPDPEVPEKKPRRKFTAKYKLRILEEADACTQPGQLGALLRREGLYSSYLTTWRKQKAKGLLQAMTPKKRGRKRKEKNPLSKRVAKLEKENLRLQQKLKRAELIIEAQKKMSEILGIAQNLDEIDESK